MSDLTSKQHWARADKKPLMERLVDYWAFATDSDGTKIEVFPKAWGYEASEELETKDRKIERLREAANVEMSMHLVTLSAIAHDDAMECRCGHDPYTDGAPCPKCFAISMYEEMFHRAPKKAQDAMANKPREKATA